MRVELSQVSHQCEQGPMFDGLSFSVASGSTLVICGRSGSGKSLLFSLLCGLTFPEQGKVLFDGEDITQLTPQQNVLFRRQLGVVFQVSALISNLSLRENLLLPLNLYFPDTSIENKNEQVQIICHEFGLDEFVDCRIDKLSTGLAALAALARALIIEPRCLIWDAPMSEIDMKWAQHIHNRLRHLKQQGTTLILFSNRQSLIEQLADQTLDLSELKTQHKAVRHAS